MRDKGFPVPLIRWNLNDDISVAELAGGLLSAKCVDCRFDVVQCSTLFHILANSANGLDQQDISLLVNSRSLSVGARTK